MLGRTKRLLPTKVRQTVHATHLNHACVLAYMFGPSKQKIRLTMKSQMQHTGAAMNASLMDWRKRWSQESTKRATVATRLPLRWLATYSQQHEEALTLSRIRYSTPLSWTKTLWTDHEHYASVRRPTTMMTSQDQPFANGANPAMERTTTN